LEWVGEQIALETNTLLDASEAILVIDESAFAKKKAAANITRSVYLSAVPGE